MKKNYILVVLFFVVLMLQSQAVKAVEDEEKDYGTEDLKLFKRRCSLCHNLDRIFKKGNLKPWEWVTIVSWMKDQLPDVFTDKEAKKIAGYLATDRYLFEYRCTKCHSLDVVFIRTDQDFKKWLEIVKKEQTKGFIPEEEVDRIAYYIYNSKQLERKKLMQDMLINLSYLEKNLENLDPMKLIHTAEAISVCSEGICKFPPLDKSDKFNEFANKLNDLTDELKKTLKAKTKDIQTSKENINKIRKTCEQCHGVLRE